MDGQHPTTLQYSALAPKWGPNRWYSVVTDSGPPALTPATLAVGTTAAVTETAPTMASHIWEQSKAEQARGATTTMP